MIADAVFSRVTGEKGFFDSRIVFVDELPKGSTGKVLKRSVPALFGPGGD